MAKWTMSSFVNPKNIKVTGTDYARTTSSDNPTSTADSPAIKGMADSLATQTGQSSMGDSRATSK